MDGEVCSNLRESVLIHEALSALEVMNCKGKRRRKLR